MSIESIAFWLLAAAMVIAALAFVLPRLIGRDAPSHGSSRDVLNARVIRAEIEEIDRERAAGVLSPADHERSRAELARRLLDDVPVLQQPQRAMSTRGTGVAIAIALPVLAFALYLTFGTPSAVLTVDDGEFAAAPLSGGEFRAQLVAHLAGSPRDGRAWVALARLDMGEDRFDDAATHFAKALEMSPKIARDAGVLCEYADALGMAQGGRLEGKPAEAIERALVLDSAHPRALEMAGSAAYERRDFRRAAQYWRTLLAHYPAGTPAHIELAAAVERAEQLASTTLPPAAASVRRGG